MSLGFGGEVAQFYARFRRGYPEPLFAAVVDAFGLAADDVVVDLGCGTGQLTLPLAGRVRAVLGMDPEPDMLVLARRAAAESGVTNASWVLGADADVPGLTRLLGESSVAAVTIGCAIHWMRPRVLFPALLPLLRPGGGVAVIANGIPQWLQDTACSRRLKGFLEQWLGHPLRSSCGTDSASREEYRAALAAAGFTDIHETIVEYTDEVDPDHLVGSLYSAMPADRLPAPADRAAFAAGVHQALEPDRQFTDHVRVAALLARTH